MKGLSKESSSNRSLLIVLGISAALVLFGAYFRLSSLSGSVTGYGTQATISGVPSVQKGTDVGYAVSAQYGSVTGHPVLVTTSVRVPWGFTYKSGSPFCSFSNHGTSDWQDDTVNCKPSATPYNGGSDTYMLTFSTDGARCGQQAMNWATVNIQDLNTQQISTAQSTHMQTTVVCR